LVYTGGEEDERGAYVDHHRRRWGNDRAAAYLITECETEKGRSTSHQSSEQPTAHEDLVLLSSSLHFLHSGSDSLFGLRTGTEGESYCFSRSLFFMFHSSFAPYRERFVGNGNGGYVWGVINIRHPLSLYCVRVERSHNKRKRRRRRRRRTAVITIHWIRRDLWCQSDWEEGGGTHWLKTKQNKNCSLCKRRKERVVPSSLPFPSVVAREEFKLSQTGCTRRSHDRGVIISFLFFKKKKKTCISLLFFVFSLSATVDIIRN